MKKIAIYKRVTLERKQKGFFADFLEVEILKDFTPKKQADFETAINAKKRIKFEKVGEFNLTTEKGKKDFLKFLIEFRFIKNQNCTAYELAEMLNAIFNTFANV